jgi:metal-dependent hydrolase (beta-lactamase superfamily II)
VERRHPWWRKQRETKRVHVNHSAIETVRHAADLVTWTKKPTQIADGIFVTGEIPRRNSFEDTGGRFFLDTACECPDLMVDDQAPFFDTTEGIAILLGCGYAGARTLRLMPGRCDYRVSSAAFDINLRLRG